LNELIAVLDVNTRAILEAVSQRVIRGADSSLLDVADIGCGEGRLLGRLGELGVRSLTGVGWMVAVPLGAHKVDRVNLSEAGWSSRLEGHRFDWVVSTEVIEHLVNPFQYLVELRQLISPKGRLLLTFPNVHGWRSIVGYAVGGRFSGFFGSNFNDNHPLHDQHIFIPNLHLVRYFLRLAGFTITEMSWVNGNHRLTAQTTMLVAEPCDPVVLP
jgi:2-polyprenyl-3-methyl-5-hydroxy-6-metoxy-1,4-benzoquinol methylase